MPRQSFYDPKIQEEQQPMHMRGFAVAIGGTYVLLDDVVSALRAYAQSLDDPDQGAAIHEVATWLISGESVPQQETGIGFEPEAEVFPPAVEPPYGAEPGDGSPDIDRVEIFPDPPDDPRPKWYARSVDTSGYVMQTSGGSFDFDWVVKNAGERWPEKPIHLLKNAGEDSKWTEDQNRGVFPSKGPPIRRLWAGVNNG